MPAAINQMQNDTISVISVNLLFLLAFHSSFLGRALVLVKLKWVSEADPNRRALTNSIPGARS